jgi:hypothetical protein
MCSPAPNELAQKLKRKAIVARGRSNMVHSRWVSAAKSNGWFDFG